MNQGKERNPKNRSRFSRSVRLDRDLGDAAALDGYVLTPLARQVLRRLLEGVRPNSRERAWTLTGPYGGGKSAFALFLSQLLREEPTPNNLAWKLLRERDPELYAIASDWMTGKPLFPVAISARRASFEVCVREGLAAATARLAQESAAAQSTERLLLARVSKSANEGGLVDALELFRDAVVAQGRYRGLLVVVDELGKILEHAGRHPGEDVFLLQEIAEVASRSGEHPIVFVGVLHQAFEHYGEHLDQNARREWVKVQGRFADVAFLEPVEQQMEFAAHACSELFAGREKQCKRPIKELADWLDANGGIPKGWSGERFADLSERAYPLHPTVLVALPYLFRRFAQNDRSLFAFLLGREPFGVRQLVEESDERLIRLDDLFEYFMVNLARGLGRHPGARHWFEVVDALHRSPYLSVAEERALKAVGLLTIIGNASPLKATRRLVSLALEDDPDSPEIAEALESLRQRSLLVYRRLFKTYRVWEGGDVDVEDRLEEGRQKTAGRVSVVDVISRYLPRRPLVARRHSYETGALRFFDLCYLEEPVSLATLVPKDGADGLILCALPASDDQVRVFLKWGESEALRDRPELVLVVPEELGSLREYAAELAALAWVEENTPELRDDRVARRELAERRSLVERAVSQAVRALLDPRPETQGGGGARWVHQGRLRTPHRLGDAVMLLSDAMDIVYPSTPRIRNELINRRSLSSAAAGARRTLVERMLTHPGEPLLGLQGYPPERSIYESVLMASGIHRMEGEEFGFFPPPPEDPVGLRPVWGEMERAVFSGTLEKPYPVNRLFQRLSAPPFGVMAGVAPILFAAFFMANRDEISLYRDQVFLPEPSVADFEILMRRPELFAVAGIRVQGEREAVVHRIAQGLQTQPTTVAVVRALLGMVKRFPDTAWRTRNLPENVLALRSALEQARSPERLLFLEIPRALGMEGFHAGEETNPNRITEFFDRLNAALQEWAQFTPRRIGVARDILLKACGLPEGERGWGMLREQARSLASRPLISTLVPFVKRLTGLGEEDVVLESVLALIAERPPRSWTDSDTERFPHLANALGEQFRRAVYQLGVVTREEEGAAIRLVQSLRKQIGDNVPPHVARAALARLLQELEDTEVESADG